MPIYKDEKRNTWYASVSITNPITKERFRKVKRGFETKREAKDWELHILSQKHFSIPSISFKEMSFKWEAYTQATDHMKRKHKENFTIRFSDFYEKPINKITKQQLIAWRNELAKSEYATKTKNNTIQYVKSVFKYANEIYDMPNPALFIKSLKSTDEEIMKEMSVWTPDEFNKFIKFVDLEVYRILFSTLYWTGMRRGEALGLLKNDYKDGWINIHATLNSENMSLKPTKTKHNRKVKVDDDLAKDLETLSKRSGLYLFGDETPLNPNHTYEKFMKWIKIAGVKKIRIHDLRHSHATWLINNGVNIVAVSKRLGHTTIDQTLKTYTHLLNDTDENMMNIINNYKKSVS